MDGTHAFLIIVLLLAVVILSWAMVKVRHCGHGIAESLAYIAESCAHTEEMLQTILRRLDN